MPGSSPSTETASASRQVPPAARVSAPRSLSTCSPPEASVSRVPASEISMRRSTPSSVARERIDSTW